MFSNRQLFFNILGQTSEKPLAVEIDHAAGIYLYGPGGERYADLISGVSVSNTGHSHPMVLKAIEEQSRKYLHLMVYGELIQSPQVRFAELLTSLLPRELNSIYYVNSGSEAIEGAMKLAKRHNGRQEIIAFHNAYHGSTQGALSILGNDTLKTAFKPLLPGIRFIRFNNFEDLEMITEKTSGVFAELVQAEAGVQIPDPAYIKALRERCTETGALLVADEVQTGFGRTGKLFCFEHYEIVPDILVIAKGMGGGLPLGAFIAGREMMSGLSHDPALGHITTFGGHPLSCAAAIANLEVICDEHLAEKADEKGRLFEDILGSHKKVKCIRRKGLFMAVELHNPQLAEKVVYAAPGYGFMTDMFLFCPSAFRVAPPLIIEKDEIVEVCSKIMKCLDQAG